MKKANRILWGIILIGAGVIFGLKSLGIVNVNVFFDGWWTLFIIVPCLIGLFTEREKTGNIIGIAVGVILLLACRDILSFSLVRKLIVPAIIVIIGLKLIVSSFGSGKANEIIVKNKEAGKEPRVGCAAFSGCNMNFDGEVFDGADLTAAFGGVKCDLRGAIIEKDCVIKVTAVFGGIDVLVPENVNVKVNTTSIFGGASNKTVIHKEAPTIYVNGLCMFGGVEIK